MADPATPQVEPERGRVSVTRILLRLLACAGAFTVAASVAAIIGVVGLYRGLEVDPTYEGMLLGTSVIAIFVVLSLALPVFAVFIVLSEAFRWRQLIVHLLAGAASALVLWLAELGALPSLDDRRLVIAIAAGIVGGLVYWLLAGRKAGAYREPRYAAADA